MMEIGFIYGGTFGRIVLTNAGLGLGLVSNRVVHLRQMPMPRNLHSCQYVRVTLDQFSHPLHSTEV